MSNIAPMPVREAINRITGNGHRKPKDPTFDWEDVGPTKAEKWLGRNLQNRRRRQTVVQKYATEMRNGRWEQNGETIKFDTEGNLINGQHTLAAIVLSGATVRLAVCRGLPPQVFATLDQGVKRSGADYLYLLGEKNCNYLQGALGHLRRSLRGDQWTTGPRYFVSPKELEETLEAHPGIRDSIAVAERAKHVVSTGLLAFLHYAFHRKNAALADWFVDKLATGESLTGNDAVYRLRETLLRVRNTKARMHWVDVMRLTISAWNKHRAGERCRVLRVPDGFPDIE